MCNPASTTLRELQEFPGQEQLPDPFRDSVTQTAADVQGMIHDQYWSKSRQQTLEAKGALQLFARQSSSWTEL